MLGLHSLQRQWHEGTDLRCCGNDVLRQLGIALLGHGATAHRPRGYGLFDLTKLLLHERKDLVSDLTPGGCQHAEERDILSLMIADSPSRDGHRSHIEPSRHLVLRSQSN